MIFEDWIVIDDSDNDTDSVTDHGRSRSKKSRKVSPPLERSAPMPVFKYPLSWRPSHRENERSSYPSREMGDIQRELRSAGSCSITQLPL